MFILKPTPFETDLPNRRAGDVLENFCDSLLRTYPKDTYQLSVARFAQEFRIYFRLPSHIPVSYLHEFIDRLGIEIITARSGTTAMCTYSLKKQRYEIHIPCDDREEGVSILHELFEIIWSRCANRSTPWAQEWLRFQGVTQAHQLADKFAYSILLPTEEFREKAFQTGYNVLELATYFGVRPTAILQAVNLKISLPCPVFIARLNFRNLEKSKQLYLSFAERDVEAEVWAANLKRGSGKPNSSWDVMPILKQRFPPRKSKISVDGFMYQAIKEKRSIQITTDTILYATLPCPVFAVARPNGVHQSQLFLQVVPVGYEDILLDDVLREQLEGVSLPSFG